MFDRRTFLGTAALAAAGSLSERPWVGRLLDHPRLQAQGGSWAAVFTDGFGLYWDTVLPQHNPAWVNDEGQNACSEYKLTGQHTWMDSMSHLNLALANNQAAEMTFLHTRGSASLGVRTAYVGANNFTGYLITLNADAGTAALVKRSGFTTDLNLSAGSYVPGDVWRIEAVGTTIRVLRNGVQQAATTDGSFASGTVLVRGPFLIAYGDDLTVYSGSGSPTSLASLPLLQPTHFSKKGILTLPPEDAAGSSLGYGGYGLSVGPGGDSLYYGNLQGRRVGEFSIPTMVGTRPNMTGSSVTVRNIADVCEGRRDDIWGGSEIGAEGSQIFGTLAWDGALYVNVTGFYDEGVCVASLFKRSQNFLTSGVSGPAKINPAGHNTGFTSGPLAVIPAAVRSEFGGKPCYATGWTWSRNQRCSAGADFFAFDPNEHDGTSLIQTSPACMYYLHSSPIADPTTPNPYWNRAAGLLGTCWPSGTRTIVYFVRHGLGREYYGDAQTHTPGTIDYDPCSSGGGYHAFPYAHWVELYDALDLVRVRDGILSHNQVLPYSTFEFDLGFGQCAKFIYGGFAYRDADRTCYIAPQESGGPQQLHVLEIAQP